MAYSKKFAIVITTKNRVDDLLLTLQNLRPLLDRADTRCIVCDDGSTDGTSQMVALNFPEITLVSNQPSKGYLFSRNRLLEIADAEFAISLDDDAHFLSADPLEEIDAIFSRFPQCGVIAFRIFWSKTTPEHFDSNLAVQPVKSFVGCGHAWRMAAWESIPPYPIWFKFYGEEDFASYELLQKNFNVVYAPAVLVQHRVDLKARRDNPDHLKRLRRSLASGWFLYFLFLPVPVAFRKFGASVWAQFRKRKLYVIRAVLLAFADLLFAVPMLLKSRHPLTKQQLQHYQSLADAMIFWRPDARNTKL